ncbi:MAG: hypothetical protein KatS3mg077_2174 [Candidatus Binatia bacterium]|nr:MAG: hypothetical protein KatS3mg077_2174 [Candidatus Binatia bacterium]
MKSERGSVAWVAAAIGVLLVVLGLPLLLHFGQKRHNRLDFDFEQRFPAGTPLVSGEVFAATLAAIVRHELDGGTGWRPNDFVLWGPALAADNNANRQLGILQAVRESVRVFKDHLTKVSSDQFDANLVRADTAFRNDLLKFWFPSAESKLREGVRALEAYIEGLHATPPRSRPINLRNVELIRLFQAWTDLLGDVHARLYRDDVSFFRTDDEFYYSQGVAHALHYLVLAVAREYREVFAGRAVLVTLLDEVALPLGKAARLKPLWVLNGKPDGLCANHRRNLDAFITEARQKMYSIREELEK